MAVFSYNGWTASPDPTVIGINTEWEPIPGHRFPGGCRSGDVETVLTYVVRQLDARVEPIDRDAVKDEWGWFYKPSANSPDLISCHSSGTAFDYNATRHPNGHRGTFTAGQVATIRAILREVRGVVYWGGDRRTADEMHFEIQGTRSEVAVVAASLRTPEPVPVPVEDDDVRTIVKGDASAKWWITDGISARWVNDRDEAKILVLAGLAKWDAAKETAFVVPQSFVDDLHKVSNG